MIRISILLVTLVFLVFCVACTTTLSPDAQVRVWAADSSIYVENNSLGRIYTAHFPEKYLPVINWAPSVSQQQDTGGIAVGMRFRIPIGKSDRGVPFAVFYWWREQNAQGVWGVAYMSSKRIVP